jgi:hypothetical protein
MPGYFYAYYSELISPEQTKYTALLHLINDDPDKLPEAYVFLPSLRRALRLSSGARCAPYAAGDYVGDDILNGIPNPTGWFSVTRHQTARSWCSGRSQAIWRSSMKRTFLGRPLHFRNPRWQMDGARRLCSRPQAFAAIRQWILPRESP